MAPDSRIQTADVLVIGSYFAGLGAFRSVELLSLPDDMVVHPAFPSWLLVYLGALCGALVVSGALLLVGALMVHRAPGRARKLGVMGGANVLLVCAAHAVFLAGWERAFAQGGLFPGIKHMLLLSRVFDPTYQQEFAIQAYRVGQFVALGLWAAVALYVIRVGLLPEDKAYDAKPAPR